MTRFDDRKQVLWATTGGDEKAYRAFNIDYAVQTADMIDNGAWIGDYQKDPPWHGATYGMPSFSTELKGGDDGTTAIAENALMAACGMDVDVASGVATIDLGDLSSDFTAADIKVNMSGLQYETTACAGDFKLTMEAGKFGIFDWKFRGNTPASFAGGTEVALAALTDNGSPTPCDAMSFGIGPVAGIVASQVCNKIEIALNNVIDPRPDIGGANGFGAAIITSRKPTYKFWIEASAIATINYESLFLARTTCAFTATYNAGGGTNQVCVITGHGKISEYPTLSNLNGKMIYEVTLIQDPDGNLLTFTWA